MAKKILIASGDSWTGGTHRDKPNSYPYWPEILADKLNMDYINFGRGEKVMNLYITKWLILYV